jgi:hypothetical protein
MTRQDQFVSTLTEKLLLYALGRGVEYYDMPTVRAITREAARNNYKFSSILIGIVKSVPFQMKIKKVDEKPAATIAASGKVVSY